MPVTKVLARDFDFEVETSTAGTYVAIGGINTFSLPAPEGSEVDITDFGTDGWDDFTIASRVQNITLEGFFMEDQVTKVRDAGQDRLEILGRGIGTACEAGFRIYTPGRTMISGRVAVLSAGGPGGGVRDVASWSASLRFKGKPTIS